MKMKRIYSLLVALFAGLCVFAQGNKLNQTVQVTNTYKTDLNNFEKNSEAAFIPDSLYKFDLNFDYGGFSNPYKGTSLGFVPSYTDLELANTRPHGDSFYLRAGAGYTFHPELDLEWTFWSNKRLKMGMFARNRSYVGDYHNIEATDAIDGKSGNEILGKSGKSGFGYSSMTLVGINGRADWEKLMLRFDLSYDGVHSKMNDYMALAARAYNSVRVRGELSSLNSDRSNNFRYGAKVDYVLGSSLLSRSDARTGRLLEHVINVGVNGGYDFFKGHSICADVVADAAVCPAGGLDFISNTAPYDYLNVLLNPRYSYSSEKVKVEAGMALLVTGVKNVNRGRNVLEPWPVLKLEWKAIEGWLDVFASSDLKGDFYGARSSAFNDVFNLPVMMYEDPTGDVSKNIPGYAVVKRRTVDAGLRGSGWDAFWYEIGAGFETVENRPMYAVSFDADGAPGLKVVMLNVPNVNARVKLGFDKAGVKFNASAEYLHYYGDNVSSIKPSAFNADVNVSYDIRSRIKPCVGCYFQSPYTSNGYRTQFIYDLYASVEGRLNNNISLYLKGSNLLNRANQYIPMVASRGVEVTAGVVLNF